jgi:glucan phosphoethanolaminetransferase (alkaline phosphatase superfamily)
MNSLLLGKLLICGGFQVILFFGLQAWLDDTMIAVGFSERIQEMMALPPLDFQDKILIAGIHGVLTAILVWLLSMVFLRSFFEQLVVIGSLAFVLGIFAPAFANFQQIEPLLLVDQIFIGLCRTFALIGFASWMFRRPLE